MQTAVLFTNEWYLGNVQPLVQKRSDSDLFPAAVYAVLSLTRLVECDDVVLVRITIANHTIHPVYFTNEPSNGGWSVTHNDFEFVARYAFIRVFPDFLHVTLDMF